MTDSLYNFAARLREFIAATAGRFGAASPLHAQDEVAFATLALELFALQFAHNPAYRKICEARGVALATVTHWTQIPAVPTAAFKELELTCLAPEQRTAVFHSSGTTEQRPSRHFHCAESLALYETSARGFFNAHYAPELRPLILTPPPEQTPHSSLVHMFEMIRRDRNQPASAFVGALAADGSWVLNLERAQADLAQAICDDTPLLLLGTAFSFVHLLDALAEQNLKFRLPTGSRVMETGGYKGRSRTLPKAELHALISDRLGVPPAHIGCEYGMSELSSQAYDTGKLGEPTYGERSFHFPPWARAQLISPETGRAVAVGETGLIRIVDLANAVSVLAIQTEDLGVRHPGGFKLLGRAQLAESRGCSLMPAA
ncbi:MAG TPA: hypothetical protein VL527_17375 [Dongiaceae bacterium]|nr:hypothetical protein [Dongiaceae bacterium]